MCRIFQIFVTLGKIADDLPSSRFFALDCNKSFDHVSAQLDACRNKVYFRYSFSPKTLTDHSKHI